ncbi:MAG: transcription factor TFIIIB subunit brf1 [Peltula sp. TS41687]|nr:MAG: transcription factor TFIIIB subunit brf1 [Peltula sp. TS41687]
MAPPPIKQVPEMTRLKGVRNPPPIIRRGRQATNSRICPNPSCTDPRVEDCDDKRVCMSCMTLVSDSNIVSEVQFGETSSGAAIVQGSYVGADQSHARNMGGGAFKRGGGMDSREVRDANGRRYINQLAAALHIPPGTADTAFQVYKLAACQHFNQGRRTKNVAAVALYVACRKQKRNSVMLIDFADVLSVNVFKLGNTFTDFVKEVAVEGIEPLLAENMVYRFAAKLEFGRMTERVAQDAVRLVQRMNRDWMTTGRRPSGICGACLILAARMNNFRRTVREVVYVVKVADMTLNKRLEEFKETESSNLTVEQFRVMDLEKSHDPPAFYQRKNGKNKRKRKRPRQGEEDDDDDDVDQDDEDEEQAERTGDRSASTDIDPREESSTTTAAGARRELRRDKDGFAIPDIPIDPKLLAASANALSRLSSSPPPTDASSPPSEERPSRRPCRRPEPPAPSAEQIAEEEALETEISQWLNDPSTQEHARHYSRAAAVADSIMAQQPASTVSMEETIDESEFADDPEVANCVLSPEEQEVKERIWVHENRDYLRAQQQKMFREQMEEKNGVVKPAARKRKRKGRIGAGGDGTVASSPAEATVDMLRRRGYSKKINYSVFDKLYEGSASRRASREASVVSTASSIGENDANVVVVAREKEKGGKDREDDGEVEEEDEAQADEEEEEGEEQQQPEEGVEEMEDEDMVDDAIDDVVEESVQDSYRD